MDAAPAITHPTITQLVRRTRISSSSHLTHATERWDVEMSDGRRVHVCTDIAFDILDEIADLDLDPGEIHLTAATHAIHTAATWGGLVDDEITIDLGWNDVCAHIVRAQ